MKLKYKENKWISYEIVYFVFGLILAAMLFYQTFRLRVSEKKYLLMKSDNNLILKNHKKTDYFLGARLDVNSSNLKEDIFHNTYLSKKNYLLFLVIGKLNCNSCVTEIRDLLLNLSQQEMHVFTVLYTASDESLQRFKDKFAWDFPIVTGDFTEWYEEHDLIVGPSIFLVDGKTGKVLNCLINASDDFGGRKRAFYDFLERMFGKSSD